jgi:O-antigen/teichoic acid export membrane protein
MSAALGAGARRIAWVIADQVVASILNFGIALFVAREVSPAAFGAFAISFTIYLLCLGLSRSCASAPLGIRFSTESHSRWQTAAANAGGLALTIGFLGTLLLLSAGLVVGLSAPLIGKCLASLAIVLPGLLVQDHWRYAFFARGKPAHTLLIDLVWVLSLVAFLICASLLFEITPWIVIFAWGLSATLAACVGALCAGTTPHLSRGVSWARDQRDLIPSLAGEFALSSGLSQALTFIVAFVGGLGAAGALRGAQVLFGPVNVVVLAAHSVALPEGARLRKRGTKWLQVGMYGTSTAIVLAALAWGLILTLLLPADLGRSLLGDTWDGAEAVLPASMALMATLGAATGAVVGLRVLEQPQRILRLRALSAPLLILGGTLGAFVAGAPGAVWGQCLPLAALVTAWWLQFREVATDIRRVPPINR